MNRILCFPVVFRLNEAVLQVGITEEETLDNGWYEFEVLYRSAGWWVTYNSIDTGADGVERFWVSQER